MSTHPADPGTDAASTARSGRRIAAFDFDGTITTRDTLVPFLARHGRPQRLVGLTAGAIAGVAARNLDRDELKASWIERVFRGMPVERAEHLGRMYAESLPRIFRPEVLQRIDRHRSEGHELVIVSASLEVYLRPVAERLGFHHVIGVELEAGSDGRLTGAMARPNVRAEEKAVRIREWLGGEEPAESWAYGNTSHDHALMAWAHNAVWLGRPERAPAGAEALRSR